MYNIGSTLQYVVLLFIIEHLHITDKKQENKNNMVLTSGLLYELQPLNTKSQQKFHNTFQWKSMLDNISFIMLGIANRHLLKTSTTNV